MRTKRAWVALLLALLVALSPLAFGPFAPSAKGAAGTAGAPTHDPTPPSARHGVRSPADTRAVLPQAQSLPAPQEACHGMPTTVAHSGPYARHAAHTLCAGRSTYARFIPAQAVQCYMDHPHHAPPPFA